MTNRTPKPPCRRWAPSRHRWAMAASMAGLLIAVMTTAASASHRHGSSPQGTYGVRRVSWTYRHQLPHRHRAQHQFDHGYAAGRRDGWSAGYSDGLYVRAVRARPPACLGRRSRHYVAGYRRGYTEAYNLGYRQGKRDRRQSSCDRRWSG